MGTWSLAIPSKDSHKNFLRSWRYEGIYTAGLQSESDILQRDRQGYPDWLQCPSQGYGKYGRVGQNGEGNAHFRSPDACLDSITPRASPRGKRSSSSLSRVAGLIHLRGSLSKIRARLRSTTLWRARDPWRYRSWIPIYPSFLPSCFPHPSSWAPTIFYSFDSPINPTVPFSSRTFGTFKRIDVQVF